MSVKIMNDKRAANLTLNKMIVLILVVLVIFVVLMFIFKPEIWDKIRNLPDYTYNDTDRELEVDLSDLQLAGMCPDRTVASIGPFEGKLGFKHQYIYFLFGDEQGKTKQQKTNLYWKGDEKQGQIWLLEKDKFSIFGFKLGPELDWFDKDRLVATVKVGFGNFIKVEPEFFNKDSELHQRLRFNSGNLDEFLKYAAKLNGSYLASNNKFCKTGDDYVEITGWPESEGKRLNRIKPNLELKRYWATLYLGRPKQVKIDFSPYIIADGLDYFYLFDRDEYFEISGHKGKFNYPELGRIYPDGSVWISDSRMKQAPFNEEFGKLNVNDDFFYHYNKYYKPNYETNLIVDYEKIKIGYKNLKK